MDLDKKACEAIAELAVNNPAKTLGLCANVLVTIIEEQVKVEGGDHTQEIKINDTGDGRTIVLPAIED